LLEHVDVARGGELHVEAGRMGTGGYDEDGNEHAAAKNAAEGPHAEEPREAS
jgi:hypothetical protein